MSKRNRINNSTENSMPSPTLTIHQDEEYQIIKNDLIRVILLNILILGIVLAVYATDRKSHYLEQIFNQIFHN